MHAETTAGPLLDVRGLRTEFTTTRGALCAVDDVSFTVGRGEIVGLVGESGSGKSVTARSVMRLVGGNGRIVAGEVRFDGVDLMTLDPERMRRIRGRRIALVPQDAMVALNPLMRVGQQIAEVLRTHERMSRAAARKRAVELLDDVGIPEPHRRVDAFPGEFSGGMLQRAVIAMALGCEPQLIIADEPTTALDVTISEQVVGVLEGLRDDRGIAVLMITHDLGLIAGSADRVNIMYAGRIVESGPVRRIFGSPRHHYTLGLMRSIPRMDRPRTERLVPIEGKPPVLHELPEGCAFAPRCPASADVCATRPELVGVGPRHRSACWDLAAPSAPVAVAPDTARVGS